MASMARAGNAQLVPANAVRNPAWSPPELELGVAGLGFTAVGGTAKGSATNTGDPSWGTNGGDGAAVAVAMVGYLNNVRAEAPRVADPTTPLPLWACSVEAAAEAAAPAVPASALALARRPEGPSGPSGPMAGETVKVPLPANGDPAPPVLPLLVATADARCCNIDDKSAAETKPATDAGSPLVPTAAVAALPRERPMGEDKGVRNPGWQCIRLSVETCDYVAQKP